MADRAGEPVLQVDQIQGNIIPGFNKDFQTFLFLRIVKGEETHFKEWLRALIPSITTTKQVLAFRDLLTKEEKHGQPPKTKSTWVNIAFSYEALKQLNIPEIHKFKDVAFREGLWQRSEGLGDPKDSQQNWVVGGNSNTADVILTVASDDRLDLHNEVARIETSIYAPITKKVQPTRSGATVIFKQQGANLPEPLAGHEHFGFRDGISQPGIRGRISPKTPPAKNDYLTQCENRTDPDQGNPGQELLWPGEFVFVPRYPKQNPKGGKLENWLNTVAPSWAENGSFLVVRRLRQDVHAFHKFLHDTAAALKIDSDLLGAKCVGRWASGAPIVRTSMEDDAALGQNDFLNNDFKFRDWEHQDPSGLSCPFAAHIRKVYPRDDEVESGQRPSGWNTNLNENETQTHRLLRRGIPYGEPSPSSPHAPLKDKMDRGLLFLSYQTSIENQFEFIQKKMANNSDFKEQKSGHDPIIGQNNGGSQTFLIKFKDKTEEVS
ncbi:MAG: Dyp-type peroxidase, partial [Candidatus Binatia bacterium]